MVEKLAEAIPMIEKTFGWLQRNSGWVGPLATGLGILAGIIGLVVLGTKLWAAAQIALNVAMMLNPVGLIILAVIGLIALVVGLWMKFEGFRNFWIGAWRSSRAPHWPCGTSWSPPSKPGGPSFSGFWTGVGRFFAGLWNGIVDGVKSAWGWITDKFDQVVSFLSGLPGGSERRRAHVRWDQGCIPQRPELDDRQVEQLQPDPRWRVGAGHGHPQCHPLHPEHPVPR
ncbi:hypothetical protein [Micromonospora pallida]|uniref:hypothetical protein n=1 Tax=Micromonospora pallida TaxID=145854 RepID=UPI000AC2AD3D|nr:hypothetical protein [Micromonospora pallida]